MGNAKSNVTSGVKKQAGTCAQSMYRLVDLKGKQYKFFTELIGKPFEIQQRMISFESSSFIPLFSFILLPGLLPPLKRRIKLNLYPSNAIDCHLYKRMVTIKA
jgi:hypothetical protein